MNSITRWFFLMVSLAILWSLAGMHDTPLSAQVPFPPLNTPDAQRNAVNAVRSQVNWLLNTTRTAPNYGAAGADKVWQEFQVLRGAYGAFKNTLTPAQLNYGANDLAELEAGLDILQEVFVNYKQDLAARRSVTTSLRNLCQVLSRGTRFWVHELNTCSTRLRVGFP